MQPLLFQTISDDSCTLKTNLGLPLRRPIVPANDILGAVTGSTKTPNDTFFAHSTNNQNYLKTINAEHAWHLNTDCSNLNIGILDSGIFVNHLDLSENFLKGKNLISGHNPNIFDDDTASSHGSHVAGIIAAVGNNNFGVAGVCWKANLVIAKVANAQGSGSISDMLKGLDYVLAEDSKVINISMGAEILNTSLTSHSHYDSIFRSALDAAKTKDALIVAAAGNSGVSIDTNRNYPASLVHSQIVSVANLNSIELSTNSNWGGGTVLLSAPGTSLLNTVRDNAFSSRTGTSMSAPLVSGSLALLWSYIGPGNIDSKRLLELLLNNTRRHIGALGTPGNKLVTGSTLDLGRAMQAAHDKVP